MTEPFQRIAVDIVGPLQPVTDRGNRYILTIIDYATRYPEAIALQGIEAERVAEALVEVFSRVGVPGEMLTDQGTQFTSEVMKEVSRLLSFKQITTTPYHPMCNGLVEKFNGTLKQMLKRMCAERPRDWDKYLNALLFAYREVPQESLGFSPFELLYGRSVRGPMMILKELWTKEIPDEEVKTTYKYILDLRERLEETCKIARQHLEKARKYQRKHYNRKTSERKMKEGDKALVLLPTKSNKLLM
jgi:transposase InsO family protein